MHRFYLPPEKAAAPVLTLTGQEAHHALHVLRLRQGDIVTVLDGAGTQILCEVQDGARDHLRLKVTEQRRLPPPGCQVTLLQALPKGKTIETIIQKATELGVARIVPLLTDRVVVHLDSQAGGTKLAKWHAVAVEAVKQCGSPWLPKIEPPITPREYIQRAENVELPMVASLQDNARHPREYFRAFQTTNRRLPSSVCVWIGPEGDFTQEELKLIQSAGARPITLGRLVLRADTAAIYCLSILNYELQAPSESHLSSAPTP